MTATNSNPDAKPEAEPASTPTPSAATTEKSVATSGLATPDVSTIGDASSRAEVFQRLAAASDQKVEPDGLLLTTSLRDDLGLGSLDSLNLVLDLEDQFGIEVDDEELAELATVGDVLALVERKTGAAPSSETTAAETAASESAPVAASTSP